MSSYLWWAGQPSPCWDCYLPSKLVGGRYNILSKDPLSSYARDNDVFLLLCRFYMSWHSDLINTFLLTHLGCSDKEKVHTLVADVPAQIILKDGQILCKCYCWSGLGFPFLKNIYICLILSCHGTKIITFSTSLYILIILIILLSYHFFFCCIYYFLTAGIWP